MAEMVPFPGLRYRLPAADLSDVIAPPYDVISPAQQDALYDRSPYNVIRLEYSRAPLPGRYDAVARELAAWRAQAVLQPEATPALYRYTQRFTHNGQTYQRTAIIGRVRLAPIDAGVIRPHEFTMSRPKEDRLALLSATRTNISPVFSLMADPGSALARTITEAAAGDGAFGTDSVGQEHRIEPITDVESIARITACIAPHPLYIADGHHRYETALVYQAEHANDPAADFTLMAVTPAEDAGLLILPIHRIVTPVQSTVGLESKLSVAFDIADAGSLDDPSARAAVASRLRATSSELTLAAAGIRPGRLVLLTLRDRAAVTARMPVERSDAWKSLAVNVLQFGILEPMLGIDATALQAGDQVAFTEDAAEAVAAVCDSHAPLAFLVPATRVDELIAVADAGDRMPQKSTYFSPKLGTGLVLNAHDV